MIDLSINYYSLTFVIISLLSGIMLSLFCQLHLVNSLIDSFLFWNIGVRGILAFIANHIPKYADEIAENYGWEIGQSFQKEIAAADGSFGLLGILSPCFHSEFEFAVILGFCFCTISSEISGLCELFYSNENRGYSAAKTIVFGMGLDLIVALVVLFSSAYVFFVR